MSAENIQKSCNDGVIDVCDGKFRPGAVESLAQDPRRRSGRLASKVERKDALTTNEGGVAEHRAEVEARKAEKARRDAELEQISLVQAGLGGIPSVPFHVVVHPLALSLVQLHAHFARTEIIGYLAGVVCEPERNANEGAKKAVYILEAFPVKNLSARDLAKEGRSAANEVEIDPESACEVQMRVIEKGMSIVGWYHSHPFFSALPSDIDVQNQHNQQTMLFRNLPYVAAICSPFWEELPDARSSFDMFYVHSGEKLVPVEVEYSQSYHIPEKGLSGTEDYYAAISAKDGANADGVICKDDRREDLNTVQKRQHCALENEAVNLISTYASFPRRTNLSGIWRPEVTFLAKLRRSLKSVVNLSGNVQVLEEDIANAGMGPSSPVDGQVALSERAGSTTRGERVEPVGQSENMSEGESRGQSKIDRTSAPQLARRDPISACSPEKKGPGRPHAEECSPEGDWTEEQRSLWVVLQQVVSLAEAAWAAADSEREGRAKAAANRKKRKKRRQF